MSALGTIPPLTAVGAVPRVVLEGLLHRSELAVLELKEARVHGITTAIITALAAVFLLLAGFAGTFALAAAVWHREDRGLILGLVAFFYVLGGGALAFLAARRLKTWQPFAETRVQFHEDCLCIRELLTPKTK